MRPAAAAVAAAAVAACLLPGTAAAHPRLVATSPSAGSRLANPPSEVMIRLSEPADPVGEGISVTGPDGREVGKGPVASRGATLTRAVDAKKHGSYVVEWLVVGSDSHPARGAFLFSVGQPTRSALPGRAPGGVVLQALGRWLSLAGFALGFGAPFAALLSGGMTRRLWRLVSVGVVLMIVAEPVALVGQTATLAPSRTLDPRLAEDVLLTTYGHLAGLRLGAALGLWALAGAVRSAPARAQWSIPAAGVAVAFVEAGSAHRFAALPSTTAVAVAAAHIGAFGAWLGCIAVAARESRSREVARPAVLAALALTLTGSGLALAHLEKPFDLVETAYGATLGVKVAIVAATLALGSAGSRRAELAAAFVVLAAASLLVSLVPPV